MGSNIIEIIVIRYCRTCTFILIVNVVMSSSKFQRLVVFETSLYSITLLRKLVERTFLVNPFFECSITTRKGYGMTSRLTITIITPYSNIGSGCKPNLNLKYLRCFHRQRAVRETAATKTLLRFNAKNPIAFTTILSHRNSNIAPMVTERPTCTCNY